MPQARVSIITPTYKQDNLSMFERMLRSVQTQTYADWEHIICSDGIYERAIDEAVSRHYDARRLYMVSQQHAGNDGFGVREWVMRRWSQGAYYLFLDDTSIIFPDYLERMVAAMLAAQAGERFVVCSIYSFDRADRPTGLTSSVRTSDIDLADVALLQVLVEAYAMQQIGWVHPLTATYQGNGLEELGRHFPHASLPECLAVRM